MTTTNKQHIFFVDDEEYGELTVAHVFDDPILDERRCRIIGFEDDLGEEFLGQMQFYGPVPVPSNSLYSLYGEEEEDAEEAEE